MGVAEGEVTRQRSAMIERRFRAVGTVVGANYGRLLRDRRPTQGALRTLEAIAKQRTAKVRGAEPLIVGYALNRMKKGKKSALRY